MQRGAQENLWPKFFLERPVARHFVWYLISTWRAVGNPLKTHGGSNAGLCRNRSEPGKIYFGRGTQSNKWAEWLWKGTKVPKFCVVSPLPKGKTLRDSARAGMIRAVVICNQSPRQSYAATATSAIILEESSPAKVKPAPLAQLDRASGYEPEGREFESLRAHHFSTTQGHPQTVPLRFVPPNCAHSQGFHPNSDPGGFRDATARDRSATDVTPLLRARISGAG